MCFFGHVKVNIWIRSLRFSFVRLARSVGLYALTLNPNTHMSTCQNTPRSIHCAYRHAMFSTCNVHQSELNWKKRCALWFYHWQCLCVASRGRHRAVPAQLDLETHIIIVIIRCSHHYKTQMFWPMNATTIKFKHRYEGLSYYRAWSPSYSLHVWYRNKTTGNPNRNHRTRLTETMWVDALVDVVEYVGLYQIKKTFFKWNELIMIHLKWALFICT